MLQRTTSPLLGQDVTNLEQLAPCSRSEQNVALSKPDRDSTKDCRKCNVLCSQSSAIRLIRICTVRWRRCCSRVSKYGSRLGWVLQHGTMFTHQLHDGIFIGCQEMHQQIVRCPSFDAEGFQRVFREIRQIPGHESIRFGFDRRCQHMPVVLIGQREAFHPPLMTAHQAIARMQVHELPSPFQLLACQVRSFTQHGGHPFLVNLLSNSLDHDLFMHSQSHQQIAQRRWIQDAGIKQDDGRTRDQ